MWEEIDKISQRVKKLRELDHRSPEDCASFIGATPERYQEIEENQAVITLPELELLALLFNVPVSVFFDDDLFEELESDTIKSPINQQYKTLRNRIIISLIEIECMRQDKPLTDLLEDHNIPIEIFRAYESGLSLELLKQISEVLGSSLEFFLEGAINPFEAAEEQPEEEYWEPEYPQKFETTVQEIRQNEENFDNLIEAIKKAPKEEQALMAQILLMQLKEN